MRFLALALVVALAACGTPLPLRLAETVRQICRDNGHAAGTRAFDRCFETTFAAILAPMER